MTIFEGLSPRCVALACVGFRPEKGIMCPHHWAKVPDDIRRELSRLYTPGQFDVGGKPIPQWSLAAVQAINAVALAEKLMGQDEASERERKIREVIRRHCQT